MTASEALQKSIEHWERLADSEPEEQIGSQTCALCQMFLKENTHPHCAGCPVFETTGKQYCAGTPYRNAEMAELEYGYDSEQFRAAAYEELKFLRSLKV